MPAWVVSAWCQRLLCTHKRPHSPPAAHRKRLPPPLLPVAPHGGSALAPEPVRPSQPRSAQRFRTEYAVDAAGHPVHDHSEADEHCDLKHVVPLCVLININVILRVVHVLLEGLQERRNVEGGSSTGSASARKAALCLLA